MKTVKCKIPILLKKEKSHFAKQIIERLLNCINFNNLAHLLEYNKKIAKDYSMFSFFYREIQEHKGSKSDRVMANKQRIFNLQPIAVLKLDGKKK